MRTDLLPINSPKELRNAVERAVELLKAEEPVALPTETVYGLAADATRADAVAKIFEAKQRPFFDPLIVHLPDFHWLEKVAEIPKENQTLIDLLIGRHWPGPLTLILPRRDIVPDIVTSGLPTVAVRISAHPVFRAVCQRLGRPLAAPSANRFGRISPTTAAHVFSELNGRIPLILDGGPTEHGLESTIIAVEENRIRILRAGPLTAEILSEFGEVETADVGESPSAPGQLKSHYAPRTPLRLAEHRTSNPSASSGQAIEHRTSKCGLLAFTSSPDDADFAAVEILSPTGDLREAAATLFAKLRRLDDAGLDFILAETVPEHGLGIAIMDRLRKAAAV